MGIRNRTPIGTLREQRKRAESVPQVEAVKAKATDLSRARSLMLSSDQDPNALSEKSENLIERLRTVLRSENAKITEQASDYEVLQDELSRISQHHQHSRAEHIKDLVDLEAPRKHIEMATPFRYVVINGGKMSDDFPVIPKLDRAPSSFEMYAQDLPKNPTPRLMPLTLLISEEAVEAPVAVPHDPSHDAAQLTQSSVTYQPAPKKGSTLPKNLVLSLLDDK